MYGKDHDVDKVALIEERLLAIVSDSMTLQTTGIPNNEPRQVRIADDLSAADSLLGVAAPTDMIKQYTIKRNRLYAMGIHFNAKKNKIVLPVLSEASEHILKA